MHIKDITYIATNYNLVCRGKYFKQKKVNSIYIKCDSIYIKFKNRPNESVLLEVTIIFCSSISAVSMGVCKREEAVFCSYDMCIFHMLSLAKNVLNDIDLDTLSVKKGT